MSVISVSPALSVLYTAENTAKVTIDGREYHVSLSDAKLETALGDQKDENTLKKELWSIGYALWLLFRSGIIGEDQKVVQDGHIKLTGLLLPAKTQKDYISKTDQTLEALAKSPLYFAVHALGGSIEENDIVQIPLQSLHQLYLFFNFPSPVSPFPTLSTATIPRGVRKTNVYQPLPRSHPQRPPLPPFGKPFYSKLIPSLSNTNTKVSLAFSVYPVHQEGAISTLQTWLNDPRVDKFWDDWKENEEARRVWLLERFEGGSGRTIPTLGEWKVDTNVSEGDDVPVYERKTTEGWFGYFEIYWAYEDKISHYLSLPSPFPPVNYKPLPYDRGLHFLVGSSIPTHRGPHRAREWLKSLCHYVFMADDRTEQIVADPDRRNEKMVGYLYDVGFENAGLLKMGETADSKVAQMVVLNRERFWRHVQF